MLIRGFCLASFFSMNWPDFNTLQKFSCRVSTRRPNIILFAKNQKVRQRKPVLRAVCTQVTQTGICMSLMLYQRLLSTLRLYLLFQRESLRTRNSSVELNSGLRFLNLLVERYYGDY